MHGGGGGGVGGVLTAAAATPSITSDMPESTVALYDLASTSVLEREGLLVLQKGPSGGAGRGGVGRGG